MLAARYETSGPGAGEMRIVEVEDPSPAAGEVLVAVAVSGVNPTDTKSRTGSGLTSAGLDEVIPNHDGSGEVVAVGAGVDPGRVGERVWLWLAQWQRAMGTAAQYVALPSEQAVALPEGASLDLGAGLGIPAMTAHRCVFGDGPVAGAAVLVAGGAGAVGHAAIELARWGGARVAATVSSDGKAQLAAAAGADLVVNYRTEDVAEAVRAWAPDGVSRVIEVNVVTNAELDAAVLAPGGTIVSYAPMAAPLPVPPGLMMRNATIEFMLVYTMPDEAKRAAVTDITAALTAGALTELPAHRFDLSDSTAAHEAVEDGAVGKVVIDIPAV